MIDNARLFAFKALDNVIRQGAYSNLAIKKSQNKLNDRDKAFCVTLVYGTLEKLITLDFILSKYLKKSPKPVVKNILRMGVYQIHFMGSVPNHAAVKTILRKYCCFLVCNILIILLLSRIFRGHFPI